MIRYYRLRDYNIILILLLVALSSLGVLLVGSADPSLQNRQLAGVLAGIALMIPLSLVDYNWILHFHWPIYVINLGLLTLVIAYGVASHGAERWIKIGGLQFQPTELSKILIILFFAAFFQMNETVVNEWPTILRAVMLIGIPLIMIFVQPDLKNTITIGTIFCMLYFAAGLAYRRILVVLLVVVPLVTGVLYLITQTDLPIVDDYQKERVMTFLEPENDEYSESAMQQDNSVMAIGSGQLTGKGLNNTTQSASKGNFIAEIQNDFIFAVAGEELGFVGTMTILLLLFLIVLMCMRAAARARNMGGRIICTGLGSLVAIQSFINIGVASGLLPNTGTPLPFVSYGLTSLLSLYIGMGLVLNVSLQRRRKEERLTYEQEKLRENILM